MAQNLSGKLKNFIEMINLFFRPDKCLIRLYDK